MPFDKDPSARPDTRIKDEDSRTALRRVIADLALDAEAAATFAPRVSPEVDSAEAEKHKAYIKALEDVSELTQVTDQD